MSTPSRVKRARRPRPQRAYRGYRALSQRLTQLVDRYMPSETTTLLLTAIVVGAVTGLAAVLLFKMIGWISWLSFVRLPELAPWLGRGWLLVIPALGGLLSGILVYFVAPQAKGSGIPAVMESLALYGGRIRPIIAPVKILATSLIIGTGGSAGREGPIVQIGSTIGSVTGLLLRLSEPRIRNLVACGAAAGIAASFNAPIAGVAFAIEVLMGELGLGMLSNVVISSVTAAVVSQMFLGSDTAFSVPTYRLYNPAEILFYAILGLVAGLLGVAFIRAFDFTAERFDDLKRPPWLKPALGGLMLGLMVFASSLFLMPSLGDFQLPEATLFQTGGISHIFGSGFESIEGVLDGGAIAAVLAILLVMKFVGTLFTVGSGSAGGVFAPLLFMGAMLGGLFGLGIHAVAPGLAPHPEAYALAGMAAVLTGAARAPLTAILIAFEMSNDYAFILPLMGATIVAAVVGHRLQPESIYTLKLARRGVRLHLGRDVDVMDAVLVNEVMEQDPETVPMSMVLSDFQDEIYHSHYNTAMVMDARNRLVGVASLQDLERIVGVQGWEHMHVEDIMTTSVLSVYPDETIGTALQRMASRDVGRLPVVDRTDRRQLVGIIRRTSIARAYQRGMLRREDMADRANQLRISQREGGTEFVELRVKAGSAVADQRVADLELPPECLLTTRRHGDHMHLLHGDDVLEPGDVILALCEPRQVDGLRRMFE